MNFKEELEKVRKEKLGLDKTDTNKIFYTILKCYKELVLNAKRDVMGYSIGIVLSNMNYYNKLGKIEYLYEKWGDNFYIDMRNSVFLEMIVNSEGELESNNDVDFSNIKELNELESISFSLKELIELCKENNISIELFSQSESEPATCLEICPYEEYNPNENSINLYLNTIKKK